MERLAREASQAVVAAGDGAPLERDVIEHLPERDGDHGEINAAAAHDQRSEDRAGDTAHQHAAQQRERRARGEELQRETGPIGTESEVSRMPERQHAGEPEQEVDGHGGEPEHEYAGAQRRVAAERRHPIRRKQQRRPDGAEHDQLAGALLAAHVSMPSSPSNPRGRISRTTAISTYMTASLAEGKKTAVTPEATPMSKPPSSVPARLPTPPTMMAMKLGISSPAPIVGSSPNWPAASTPLNPARKMPTAKFRERSARTLTPKVETVSRSSVPARMRMPNRV